MSEERSEHRGLTRAGLIKVGAAAALGVGAGGAGRALAGGVAATVAGPTLGKPSGGAAYLHRRTFLPLVGSDFRVSPPGAPSLRVKLVEARKLPSPGDAFSLLFRGSVDPGLPSNTYRIEHPALGAFDLFVSPVGRGVKGLDLEAVINRIAT